MARKRYHTESTAHQAYKQVRFDLKVQDRRRRQKLNRLKNELLLRDLRPKVLRAIRKEFKQPDVHMKRIARNHSLPRSFVVWLWKRDNDQSH